MYKFILKEAHNDEVFASEHSRGAERFPEERARHSSQCSHSLHPPNNFLMHQNMLLFFYETFHKRKYNERTVPPTLPMCTDCVDSCI